MYVYFASLQLNYLLRRLIFFKIKIFSSESRRKNHPKNSITTTEIADVNSNLNHGFVKITRGRNPINTVIKTYDIEDERGNVLGQISFNASDVNMLARLYELQETIAELIEEVETASKDRPEEIYSVMTRIETEIKSKIDYVFGDKVSEMVFGNQSIYSDVDGMSFITRFTEAVIPVIKNDLEEAMLKRAKRINEYMEQVVE